MSNEHFQIEKTSQRRKKLRILIFFMIATLGFGVFISVKSCMADLSPYTVNLAVKKEGKTYVYSNMGKFIVENQIKQNQSPSYFATTTLYKDNNLYVVPNMMTDLVHVFANNLTYFELKEKSFDGYATFDSLKVYNNSSKTKSTGSIGEQLIIYSTILKNGNDSLIISWSFNTKTLENKPILNCEIHSFYSTSSPYAGKTITSSSDYIVVPLDKIASFYKRKYSLDEEQNVLFVE